MAFRALVFDFDGLILETEGVAVRAWETVYEEHGHALPVDRWLQNLGTANRVDLHADLEALVGRSLDRAALTARRDQVRAEAFAGLAVQPGVVELLVAAREMGLATAIASSSPEDWVAGHLQRLGLVDEFAHLACFDKTCAPKPAPDLYLNACRALGVAPQESVAFEDSPNGVTAAKAAGLACVAVPTPVTASLDLSDADLVVESLAGIHLPQLLERLY